MRDNTRIESIQEPGTHVVRKESAGIQFDPNARVIQCATCTSNKITSAEYPDVIDFEQETQAVLLQQLLLDDSRTAECNSLGFRVQNRPVLKVIEFSIETDETV